MIALLRACFALGSAKPRQRRKANSTSPAHQKRTAAMKKGGSVSSPNLMTR